VISDEIVDVIEKMDELRAHASLFDGSSTMAEIQEKLRERTGEPIPPEILQVYLDDLWKRREIVKIAGQGKAGYRSRIGEILRYLYKLKLWTVRGGRQRIREDVSQVKYSRIDKMIPDRVRPVEQLATTNPSSCFVTLRQSVLGNHFGIDPVEIVCIALKRSRYQYSELSDFQMRACATISREWVKVRCNDIVLTAPTGAGKTLAFLLAPLVFCVADLLKNPRDHGTRLMLVYPRNALASNQSELVKELTYQIDEALRTKFREKGLQVTVPQLKEPLTDFRSIVSKAEREVQYREPPEILITNTETLKRRLMDPVFHSVFLSLRCVVFDEIHIYEKLHGTNIVYLIRRLRALARQKRRTELLLVGSSATIAQPEAFSRTLFSSTGEVEVLFPREDELTPSGKEHHVFLRPYMNRSPLSVAIDATSCILHNNRKGGLTANKERNSSKEVEKGIAFADSLDIVNRWNYMLRSSEKAYSTRRRLSPNYERFSPFSHDSACCDGFMTNEGVNSSCSTYHDGRLWLLMSDKPDQHAQTEKRYVNLASIWSKSYTSKTEPEWVSGDIQRAIFGFREPPPQFADLVIATTALELGVDFDNVKEIILYRALRSPTSYRQRVGRAGREKGSTSLVVTIVSPLPHELYYFRHFTSLVTPSFQPIPLKDLNVEVIRSHLFCALFDLAASNGLNLWDVLSNSNLQSDVDAAKNLAVTSEAYEYLIQLHHDDAMVKEAIANFSKALDLIMSSDCFEWMDIRETFKDAVVKMSRDHDFFYQVANVAEKRKREISDALKNLAAIRTKRAECFDLLADLDNYPGLREKLFRLLTDIDKVMA